jgi:hypothetical protein
MPYDEAIPRQIRSSEKAHQIEEPLVLELLQIGPQPPSANRQILPPSSRHHMEVRGAGKPLKGARSG